MNQITASFNANDVACNLALIEEIETKLVFQRTTFDQALSDLEVSLNRIRDQ